MAAHRFLVQLLLLTTLRASEAPGVRQSSLDPGRVHAVLRFAFGVTFAFVASELLEWIPTFLAPVLVAVVLVNVPVRPPLKVGVGLIVIIAAAALIALFLCAVLRGAPAILFGATALVVFLALHAIAQGRPRIAPILLLICVTAIPVVALQSQSAAKRIRSRPRAINVLCDSHCLDHVSALAKSHAAASGHQCGPVVPRSSRSRVRYSVPPYSRR